MAADRNMDAREKLLDALVAGVSKSEAARISGYSRIHVHRLLGDPGFVADLEKRRAEVAALPASEDEKLALGTLRDITADEHAEDKDRIAAARTLLAHHAAAKKAVKAGPAAPPPTIKVLPGDGEKAASEWLNQQQA